MRALKGYSVYRLTSLDAIKHVIPLLSEMYAKPGFSMRVPLETAAYKLGQALEQPHFLTLVLVDDDTDTPVAFTNAQLIDDPLDSFVFVTTGYTNVPRGSLVLADWVEQWAREMNVSAVVGIVQSTNNWFAMARLYGGVIEGALLRKELSDGRLLREQSERGQSDPVHTVAGSAVTH